MNEYFYELFTNLKRQGPGLKLSTHQAFNLLNCNGADKKLLDIGCGSGSQTFDIAEVFDGKITAVDYTDLLIDEFKNKLAKTSFTSRVEIKKGDMNDLAEEEKSYDIIWSEGAIFIMGFENGLRNWKKFLKDGGYLVVSDADWLSEDIPDEIYNYWQEVYPDIKQTKDNIKICQDCGYEVIDTFMLPKSGWIDEYYSFIEEKLPSFIEKYQNNETAKAEAEMMRKEIDMYAKYSDYYGYIFYILKNTVNK